MNDDDTILSSYFLLDAFGNFKYKDNNKNTNIKYDTIGQELHNNVTYTFLKNKIKITLPKKEEATLSQPAYKPLGVPTSFKQASYTPYTSVGRRKRKTKRKNKMMKSKK